ncbi:MAG: ATP-binding protein, partial [Muribaculaceae bacterium]|nr:ATP-binding protein [Muribaculaceae bacterium]
EIEITLEEPKTVVIRDTGIGIAPEDINRIFEKSYTGCNGRTDKKASGIGLYLCRQICGRLGHKITARSQVGVGTEIRINLAETDIEIE